MEKAAEKERRCMMTERCEKIKAEASNAANIDEIRKLMRERTAGTLEILRDYAVLILLTEKDDGLHFVFEKRATGIKQPGDVCFPGGRMEKGESSAECALRETEEEIGVPQDKIEILGEYATQYELTSIAMHSVVGFVTKEALEQVHLNAAEVAEVFTVPVSFFAENEPYIYEYDVIQDVRDFPYEKFGICSDYKWRVGHKKIVLYTYNDKIIWGLTAAFVKKFTEEMTKNGEIY